MAVGQAAVEWDERDLVRRAQAGEDEAFALLVERHQARTQRLAARLVGPDQSEDIAQQAFIKAWEGIGSFRGGSGFGTWLYRVTANLCLDHLRGVRRRPVVPLTRADQRASMTPDPAEQVAAAQEEATRREALRWALTQVPTQDRRLLALQVEEGLPYHRIAERLGTNAQTVGTRLHRARARLRHLVARRLVAVLVALLLAGALAQQPTVLASLELFLRRVVLREELAPASPIGSVPLRSMSLEQAQALVPWPVRQPAHVPGGYQLAAVEAGEIHTFADGTTVVLHYRDRGSDGWLAITQLRARAEATEPVAPGAAWRVSVGGEEGLFIDGRWVERGGRREWQRGRLARLIVELPGDVLVQLEGEPRHGWDAARLAEVADSLR